jgi:hypothetical protein
LSALATHGFRPDRLDLSVAEQALHVHASHKLDTRNNRDFGDAMIRSVFDEVSGAI